MIEAIPTAGDSIVLNITKVDDPDELDTRFPDSHLLLRTKLLISTNPCWNI